MGAEQRKPVRTIADSETLYTRVLEFFWRDEERDFIVRLADTPMGEWQMVPTPTLDEMSTKRGEYLAAKVEFAGFINYENRYWFYFCDQNIFKAQDLESMTVERFWIRSICEVDERLVLKQLEALAGILQGS